MWALKMLHEKNWRESLRVLEFHHPPNFPKILAAAPGSQILTGCPVQPWFHQVALIDHQPKLTLALERCHC